MKYLVFLIGSLFFAQTGFALPLQKMMIEVINEDQYQFVNKILYFDTKFPASAPAVLNDEALADRLMKMAPGKYLCNGKTMGYQIFAIESCKAK